MPHTLFCNGFWGGFIENTDGIGINVFIYILENTLNTTISLTSDINTADILLESHFG
jgi:hypothetical protein